MAEMIAGTKRASDPKPQPASKPRRYDYDIVIIGSGPAGHRAAIQSAKLGKRVAVIEKKTLIGGVSVNTGTIPSKTLREAVLHLSGFPAALAFMAPPTQVKQHITMNDLLLRADHVIRHEIEINKHQLQRNGIELFAGIATLVDQHTVHLTFPRQKRRRRSDHAQHHHRRWHDRRQTRQDIPFRWRNHFHQRWLAQAGQAAQDLDRGRRRRHRLRIRLYVRHAGRARHTWLKSSDRLLTFIDHEIVDALVYHMRQQRVTMRLGESVSSIEPCDTRLWHRRQDAAWRAARRSSPKKRFTPSGGKARPRTLGLANVDITPDFRGRIQVNEHYQTEIPNIYAVGDVVGFPSLASTSMEQGRMAACHAFDIEHHSFPALFPLRHLRHSRRYPPSAPTKKN